MYYDACVEMCVLGCVCYVSGIPGNLLNLLADGRG